MTTQHKKKSTDQADPPAKAKTAKKLSVTEERQELMDRAESSIADAKQALQELFDDLDEKRGNMEEHFSGTERYSRFEEACQQVEDAIGELENIDTGIELP